MSSNDQMASAFAQIRSLPAAMRQELKAAAEQGSPVLAASLLLENVGLLVKHLPCLSEAEAGALLAPSEYRARVRGKALVERLAPYVDEHYQSLRPVFWQLDGVVGGFGKRVLDLVLREVQRRRRARGAAEIALLDSLLQVHQNEVALAAREGGKALEGDVLGQVDAMAQASYESAVEAFLEAAGADPQGRVLGGFTLREIGYLREIKSELALLRKDLADPLSGPADQYYRAVVVMFERARELGYGPRTARMRWEIERERRNNPHVLYPALDGRGPSRWGGIYPSVRKQVTVEQAVPMQGPARVREQKVLTGLGHRLMDQFDVELAKRYGSFLMDVQVQQQAGVQREQRHQELLNTEQEEGKEGEWTWRWDYSLEELGFGVEEVERTVEVADKPWEGALSQTSVGELLEQMAEFHQRKGVVPAEQQGGTFHQVP